MSQLKVNRILIVGRMPVNIGTRYEIHWKSTFGGYRREIGIVTDIDFEDNCIIFDMSKPYKSIVENIYLDEDYGIFEIKEILEDDDAILCST